ncbi:hypothetical protein [Psychrobacter submarinus]|jgi:hypothetical protein|uniref:hypothetical protein n=1 Tax=Psychrobacter submarinus TaxID=154108 RepID=UPI00191A7302|nr:hypothetical protein [Psychrobacter submarinus]
MPSALDHNDFIATDINNENLDTDSQRIKLYARLKEREQCWWQSRQQLIEHQEQKVFWYGENSLIMWLLWQLVGYVAVAMVLMLLNNMMNISLTLWQYIALFILQTLFFVSIFAAKGRLANKLQNDIDKDYLQGEQALNEMIVLAEDSLYPDVHAKSPISLRQLGDYLNGEFHLSSLHCLLQKEIKAGRLIMEQQLLEVGVLPPELADVELIEHADNIIYKSTL